MTTDKKKSAYNRMADKLDRIQAFEGKTTQTGPDTNEDLVIFRVLVGQARETIDKMEELLVKSTNGRILMPLCLPAEKWWN